MFRGRSVGRQCGSAGKCQWVFCTSYRQAEREGAKTRRALGPCRIWGHRCRCNLFDDAAPVYVSNFAQARPSQSVTIALPFGAFLEDTLVRPGDVLQSGEIAAILRSPEIENGIVEQTVTHSLELINAQDALNTGNLGEFQLAEKRAEIALLRRDQLQSQQQQLTVTAPSESRVVTALPQGERGNFLPTGSPVVALQPMSGFDVLIDVAPSDAALIEVGQTGHVFFRGLSDETFPLEVVSAPTQTTNPDTGETRTQVRARLMEAGQADLLVGLSGFARLEIRTAPRIVGLTRPLVDYMRLLAWKTLGFTF
ncbi:efflux RND transporter periplasmic adaptor subunit (plasmid) [Octadecabacter sp. SW4]|nr:efflux RND transporter periplasmic adaptor subunit [Octadecabacter sp. SW4]